MHGQRVVSEFIAAKFPRIDSLFRFEYRELSKASYELLQRKLDRVATEFLELSDLDSTLSAERRMTTGMLLALRPWSLSIVTGLKERAKAP